MSASRIACRCLLLVAIVAPVIALSACQGGSRGTVLPSTAPEKRKPLGISDTYSSAVMADGPTAYYRLDDTGTTAADSSGHGLNGSIGSSVTESVAGLVVSSSDTGMRFPGSASSTAVVRVPQTTLLQPATAVSLEAWLYFTATPTTYAVPAGYGSDTSYAPYDLYFVSGKIAAQFELTSGVLVVTSPSALQLNAACYVVATYDGTTGRLYLNGNLVASGTKSGTITNYASGYGLSIGDDAALSDPGYKGIVDEVAVYAGKTLTSEQILNHYTAAVGSATASPSSAPSSTPSPTPAYTDWSTFGDNLSGTNYNPNEKTISAANASSLKLAWSADLGAAITAQPILATRISIGGSPTTIVYVGTEGGAFYALNAATGQTIWKRQLGTVTSGCLDLPGGVFGITGAATFDKNGNRIYVADGKDQVYALNMQNGQTIAGWPVTVATTLTKDHIYSALTYNPANGLLYAATASYCDLAQWHGRVTAINTSTATVAATFYPGAPYTGAGVWGIGGVAIDTATNNVYIATGNTYGGPAESSAYGERIVELSPSLTVIAADEPNINGTDLDFGATPMIFQPPGCPKMVAVKNKSGQFPLLAASGVASGPLQEISMAPSTDIGQFVGVTSYSPDTNLVYVGDPAGNATYARGMVALAIQANCTFVKAWQQSVGPAPGGTDDNDSPAEANGVAYLTDGIGDAVFAFNAATGQQLWSSGSIITGPTMTAPAINGRLFVSSWDHKLYAFGL